MAKSYDGVTFNSGLFPDDPFRQVKVTLNSTIANEYLPALQRALPDAPKGLKLLMISMTYQEGFKAGTRSYKNNNPANIGNTDSGHNTTFKTLEEGIKAQAEYLKAVAEGKKKSYPLGSQINIKPYYSPEIAKNEKLYGLSPYLPGYKFIYTGELQQFLKIYSTGARATNSYANIIISYFHNNGIEIKPTDTLAEIISMQ